MTWTPVLEFGDRLRLVRHKRHQTVEQIAADCGIPFRTWATWENGSRPRDLVGVVAKIAAATDVSRDWLMWGGEGGDVTGTVTTGELSGQQELPLGPYALAS